MKKKTLCVSAMLVIFCFAFHAKPVKAAEITGSWGTVPWSFESDTGVLTFTSGGTLGTYSSSPWNSTSGVSVTAVTEIVFTQSTIAPTDSTYLFGSGKTTSGLTSLTKIDNISYLDTSNVTSMKYMFNYIGMSSLDLSTLKTSSVISMQAMFANARNLTSIDISKFDTRNVITFEGMFYNNRSLTSLDLSSFDTTKANSFYDMFDNDILLQTISLGTSILFKGSHNLPSISTSSGEYTGKWIGISGNAKGKIYSSSSDFLTKYTADYAGTYVWQKFQTLEVQDSTIKTTDSWTAAVNFFSATDTSGAAVTFDTAGITTSGTVDTKTAGSYSVTYTYGTLTKTATITVEDVEASLTVEFLQGTTVLSDYTVGLTGYNVWDIVDLTAIEEITNQVANLESMGYTVTSPESADVTLSAAETTVQYTVTGALRLLVPESITFPSVTYTGDTQTLNGTGNGNLTVQDTLSTMNETGWSLQVAVTKALTSGTTLSYLDENKQSTTLNSTNQTIASAESGSKTISEDWGTTTTDAGIKLTLDGSVGVGNYSGTLTWTLQVGPEV